MNKKKELEKSIKDLKKDFNIFQKSKKIKAKSKSLASYLKSLSSDEMMEFILRFMILSASAIHKKNLSKVLENMIVPDDEIENIINELYPYKGTNGIKLRDLLI